MTSSKALLISLGRYLSLSNLTKFSVRRTDDYSSYTAAFGGGISAWIYSPGPFQGLYLKRELRIQNTWVNSAALGSALQTVPAGGFAINQDFEAGYGWAFHHYLLDLRVRFRYLSSLDAVALAMGYRW